MRWMVLSASAVLAALPLAAQEITIGIEGALTDYREQGAALRFSGSGFAGRVEATVWRLSAQARLTRVSLDGASRNAEVTDAFDMSQSELRLRMRLTPRIGAEVAALSRRISPEHAAQSLRAWRAGGVFVQPLAPGADVAVRAGYLAATDFGGGGTAPFGLDVGLAVSYGPGAGRVRLTAEYELQRVDRRTTAGGKRVDVPIQSAVARIGVAVGVRR
jgi:hypothetical protein